MHSTTTATPAFAPRPSREVALAARISADEAAVVDRYAKAENLSRAEFVRAAIGAYITSMPDPEDSLESQVGPSVPTELPASPFAQGAAFGSVAA